MKKELKEKIVRDAQFPYHKRKVQYQSIPGEDMPGIRDMDYRFKFMYLDDVDFTDKRVLDIGCSLGVIGEYVVGRGALNYVGLEYNPETVEAANEYLRAKGIQASKANVYQYDVSKGIDSSLGSEAYDYVFALSIIKHVDKDKLFEIIREYTGKTCWFEGHAKDKYTVTNRLLEQNLPGMAIFYLGNTVDRGSRPVFRIEKGN